MLVCWAVIAVFCTAAEDFIFCVCVRVCVVPPDLPKVSINKFCCTVLQGRPEKLRGPGQRVKVGPLTQVVR